MTQFPSNALDPSSQPWAREVERQLREVQGSQVQEASLRRNSADGVLATLGKLSDQIAAIAETQAALQTVVTDLGTQQATLAAQQATILSLINSQVYPVVVPTTSASGWAIGTTYGTKVSTAITVPAGYTQAIVYCSGSLSMVNNDTGSTVLYGYIDIAGNGGSDQTAYLNFGTYRAPSIVTPMHSRYFTGLVGGASISMGIVGALGSVSSIDTDLKRAQVGGFAIFLR